MKNESQEQFDRLLSLHLDAGLSTEQQREFLALIEADPQREQEFLAATRFDRELGGWLAKPVSDDAMVEAVNESIASAKAARSIGKQRRVRFALPLAIAAGMAAVIGSLVIGHWWGGEARRPVRHSLGEGGSHGRQGRSPSFAEASEGRRVARIEAASGQWTLLRQGYGGQAVDSGQYGRKRALKVGDEVREGDRIEVRDEGMVVLAYAVGARVELGADSVVSMAEARLTSPTGPTRPTRPTRLERGTLIAHVEKRFAFDRPFIIETPHARVEALGTGYAVFADENSTRMDVGSGRVRMTRLVDGKTVDVSPGQFAVAGAGLAFQSYPIGTRRIDGRILFQDDFEKGLENWQVTTAKADNRSTIARSSVGDENIVRVDRMMVSGAPTCCAVLDGTKRKDEYVGIELKAKIPSDSFVLEYDAVAGLEGSHAYGWSRALDGEGESRLLFSSPEHWREPVGVWQHFRKEYVASKNASGRNVTRLRFFRNGRLTLIAEEEGIHGPVFLSVLNGRDFVDNVVVRELIEIPAVEDYAVRAYPAGTDYVVGPVLFQENFENGLANWEIVSKEASDAPLAPFSDAGKEYARCETWRTANGKSTCAVLDTRSLDGDEVGIRLNLPLAMEPMVMEWDGFLPELGGHGWSLGTAVDEGGKPEMVFRDEEILMRAYMNQWRHYRLVAAPMRDDKTGWWDVRWFQDDKLCWHARSRLEAREFAITCHKGAVVLDNVTIRRIFPCH